MRADEPSEPVLTPRLRLGFGLLAFGTGLMFLAGKVLPHPVPAAIAGGITIGIVGLVTVIVEALREPPDGEDTADVAAAGAPTPPAPAPGPESR
jgi:hypothetical protein